MNFKSLFGQHDKVVSLKFYIDRVMNFKSLFGEYDKVVS